MADVESTFKATCPCIILEPEEVDLRKKNAFNTKPLVMQGQKLTSIPINSLGPGDGYVCELCHH